MEGGGSPLCKRIVRLALAAVLAFYLCVPSSPVLAEEGDSRAVSDEATSQVAQQQERVDQQEDWPEVEESAAVDVPGDADDAEAEAHPDSSDAIESEEAERADEGNAGDSDDEAVDDDSEGAGKSAGTADEGDESAGETDNDSPDEAASQHDAEPVDLTARWEAGTARIDRAGAYVLSDDVKASAPLVVALPKGEAATLDFAGFDVTVDGADSAIDLSANAGDMTFTDSAFDEKHPSRRSSVTLKADDPKSDLAAVSAIRVAAARNAKPAAAFEHLSIKVDVTSHAIESYSKSAAAVRTGIDSRGDDTWHAEGESVALSFDGCAFDVSMNADEESDSAESPRSAKAERGHASVIDAGCRGIKLDGRTAASVQLDGEDVTGTCPALLSEYDGAYTVGPDFMLAALGDGDANADASSAGREAEEPALVLGFPERPRSDGVAEAAVANAVAGKVISRKAATELKAPDGCEVILDETDHGVSSIKLALVSENSAVEQSPATILDCEDDGVAAPSDSESVLEELASGDPAADVSADDERSLPLGSETGSSVPTVSAEAAAPSGVGADADAAVDDDADTRTGTAAGTAAADTAAAASAAASDAAVDADAAGGIASAGLAQSAPHLYAEFLAAHPDDVVYAPRLKPQANGTDLKDAWSAQEGGLEQAYTIKSGGTYSLSADFEAENSLVVNAPGKDVTLDFAGHVLTMTGSGSPHQTMVSIVAAKSVTFEGAGGSLKSAGDLDVWAISSAAPGCAVSVKDLTVTLKSKSNQQRDLSGHCIRVSEGSLSMDHCTVQMLMGNQSLRNNTLVSSDGYEIPSAVYATANATSVELSDCDVTGEGPAGFSVGNLADSTVIGNAYAVYSLAASTLVKGGSYKAVSLRGNATCVYGTSVEVAAGESPIVAMEADAGQIAAGLMSAKAGGITLSAPVSFAVGPDYEGVADVAAALRSTVQRGFVFGACSGSGISYPALVMLNGSVAQANASGSYLGTFSDSLSGDQQGAVLASLENALGDAGACSITTDLQGVKFAFDEAKAAASVTTANGVTTYHATIDDAAAKLADAPGGELDVLRDAGAVSVTKAGSGTIDLNGHTISSLTFSTAATGSGLTVQNGAVSGSATAVSHSSPTSLTLSGVTLRASAVDGSAYGVNAARNAGSLTLSNATVFVTTSRVSGTTSYNAYGIYMPASGPAVSIENAKVSAYALTAGVSAYGLYSSKQATVENSVVEAHGVMATVAAAWFGGEFAAEGSTFDAYTSDVATTACSVWMRTSAPVATNVSLDGCTFKVRSARSAHDLSGTTYACLLGATSETGSVTPSGCLSLSGESVFNSVSGTHLGMNLGAISLGADFGLAGGSDGKLVISQARNSDSVRISSDSPTAGLASLFEARAGSYYDGWELAPDAEASRLVWHPRGGAEAVKLSSTGQGYASLAEALAAASSGDTVTLQCDLTESGVHAIGLSDLTLDLNGEKLILRGGSGAGAGNTDAGGVLQWAGAGKFMVEDSRGGGELAIEVGTATEPASGATYQGIAVSGGGTFGIDESAKVRVDYTGSTAGAASQRDVTVRGVTVTKGTLTLDGELSVKSAVSDGAIGARNVYGTFAQPSVGDEAHITVGSGAKVTVNGVTAAEENKNMYYAESSSVTANPNLREIKVNRSVDADFYDDVVSQFRKSATYDDPSETAHDTRHGARIYFAENMQLDHDGKWYDGLKLWAYSDEVAEDDVGTMAAMVPSHVFVSSYYDTLPNAYGIATGSSTAGTAAISVNGSVEASCPFGNACAVDADKAESGGAVSVSCDGADISATADGTVHPIAQGEFDLRDYLSFTLSSRTSKVAYSNTLGSQAVKLESPVARGVAVEKADVKLSLSSAGKFVVNALDAAAIELASATSFDANGFSLASGSQACSVASASGANVPGFTFARGAVDPDLFEDAYASCAVEAVSDGAAWSATDAPTVTFMSGDAVVARYFGSEDIDLSALTSRAVRLSDQRQDYRLVGWSTDPDENATEGFLETTGVVSPGESAVYYAVYSEIPTAVSVRFTNIHDSSGALAADVNGSVTYGQTVSSGLTVPSTANYTDSATDLEYRFVGWYPFTSASTNSALVYSAEQVKDLVVDMSLNGMSASGSLTLRATYLATTANQHVVKFVVDNRTSACVVDDGERPLYTSANFTNTSYVEPSKLVSAAGLEYTFGGWFIDANADGKLGEGESSYGGVLPKAVDDVVYTANWSDEPADITYTFRLVYYDEEEDVYYGNREYTTIVETTCDKSVQEVADSVSPIGSRVGYGGKVYTLEGWSTRSTDVEPVYTADNPLPEVTTATSSMQSSYSRNYYGVYSVRDHMVKVTFKNGSTTLGSANVPGLGTVENAFAATGASEPSDISASKQFLGWGTSPTAMTAVDGVSTTIDELAGRTADELELYAVYGKAPTYTVRLRSADGKTTHYTIAVRRGKTVNAVAREAGVAIEPPAQVGKYFAGWRTASGKYYSLDARVTGSANLYASYGPIKVTSASGARDIDAVVTSVSPKLEEATSVEFLVKPRSSAELPLHAEVAKNGYTIMKSYDVRLYATNSSGAKSMVTGEFGVAAMKVFVGADYRNSKVRAFWSGVSDKGDAVLHTSAKSVDSDGYISLSIGSYTVGDEDEGGNFCVAYIEGGKSGGKLSGGSSPAKPKPGSDADAGSDSGSGSGSEADSGSDSSADDGSADDSGSGAGADSESGSGSDAAGNSGSGTGSTSKLSPGSSSKSSLSSGSKTSKGSASGSRSNAGSGNGEGGSSKNGSSGSSSGLTKTGSSGLSRSGSSGLSRSGSSGLSRSGSSGLAKSSASGLGKNGSSTLGKSGSGSSAKKSAVSAFESQDGSAVIDGGLNGSADGLSADGEEGVSFFSGWESDAVALVVMAAIAVLALLHMAWRLLVVRQRRQEAEVEAPPISDAYAKGIRF